MKLILFFSAVFSVTATAATPEFRVMVKSKYDTNWIKVTQEGKKWICVTNNVPFFETDTNPLAKLDWKALEKESAARPKKCTELVGFEGTVDGKEKIVVTCLQQPATARIYREISTLCRAGI